MATQVLQISNSAWTDVTAVASTVVDQTYALQCIGNAPLYISESALPPPASDIGLILSVGRLPYYFKQEANNLYARGSTKSTKLTITENNPFE